MTSDVPFPEEASIGFELNFTGDGQEVSGQGIVRWSIAKERLTGIEITRVAEASRAWVAGLAQVNKTVSFIPRAPQ